MIALIITIVLVLILVFTYIGTENSNNNDSGFIPSTGTTGGSNSKGGVNNPGYLVCSSAKWQGKLESGSKFENFDTMRNGIRAWGINLFQKIKKGTINSPNQMIDVLTPAGSENPENARDNYKASVNKANNWMSLFYAVFNFEDNPSWRSLSDNEKTKQIALGLKDAIDYCYNGSTPQYFG